MKNPIHLILILILAFTSCKDDENSINLGLPEESLLNKISFSDPNIEVNHIDNQAKIILVTALEGSSISSLQPSFSLAKDSNVSPSTPQNFSKPVKYTITHKSGIKEVYTVYARKIDSLKSKGNTYSLGIESFIFEKSNNPGLPEDIVGKIPYVGYISVTIPHDLDSNKLKQPTVKYSSNVELFYKADYFNKGYAFYLLKETINGEANYFFYIVAIQKAPAPTKSRAIVLKHGWDIPSFFRLNNPDFVKEIEDSPYDGLIFGADQLSRLVFDSNNSVSISTIENELSPLKPDTFSRPMHNYIRLLCRNFKMNDEEAVANIAKNLSNYAKVAKAAGLEGIAFDNEAYEGQSPWVYKESNSEGPCPGMTLEQCQEATRKAGSKIMNAIIDEWPEVHFMPFFGIWLRDMPAWRYIVQQYNRPIWYADYKLEADFLVGVYQAIHKRNNTATFIDGGELYGLTKREQFKNTANYLRNDLPKTSEKFPNDDALRTSYAQNVKIGFGLYDFRDRIWNVPQKTSSEWKEMIQNSSLEADYVWLYPEMYDFWVHDGNNHPAQKAPKEWRDAEREALKK